MPTPRISIESVVVGLLVTSAPVLAEAATDTGATDLETVIVTASKREEALKDVPMSVTALSGTELDRWQQTQLSDFASQVPGMSLQQPNPGQTRLVLRGLNVGSVGSTVATVIDDIPFSKFSVPRLTTVSGSPEQNGRDAVRLLLKRLADPDRAQESIVSSWQLHIRESTGPAPKR